MEPLEVAIGLAAEAHRGQLDKGGEPYILHPLRVMLKMANDNERIVAILHDTVEDTAITKEQIALRFGNEIAEAVDALTRRDGEGYMDFIDRCGKNNLARTVKLGDIRDNLNLSRLGRKPTAKDKRRCGKYIAARKRLTAPIDPGA